MFADISSYVAGWQQRELKECQELETRRQHAVEEAKIIARFLGETIGARQVIGIGSAFDPERFSRRSDIDLVAFGLPKDRYFSILSQIMLITNFEVDLVPYESASALLKQRVAEEGVQLWP